MSSNHPFLNDQSYRVITDPERLFLTVDEVASILRCSIDHVRRIPRDELPCSRPGKMNIYRFQDIDAYVKGLQAEVIDTQAVQRLLESTTESVRGRPLRRTQ
ncbi:MAG: helix-turn-helix domain-containing protein [Alphaproteobacteria bacterium]|nr:helix-turn-helix domain-containing protein [Alphaproteobacteria bacterium]